MSMNDSMTEVPEQVEQVGRAVFPASEAIRCPGCLVSALVIACVLCGARAETGLVSSRMPAVRRAVSRGSELEALHLSCRSVPVDSGRAGRQSSLSTV